MGVRRLSAEPVMPERGDHLLGLPVAERGPGREVTPGDVVGVLLGDLLDVDPAHVGEQHHRPLADSVPDDAGVVLVLDRGLGVDEHAAGHVAVDLQREHVLGVGGGLVGRVGELDAAGLHPAAGQDLGLDDHRAADLGGDLPGLLGRGGEPVLGDRDPGLGHDRPRFVLKETHRGRGSLAIFTPRGGVTPDGVVCAVHDGDFQCAGFRGLDRRGSTGPNPTNPTSRTNNTRIVDEVGYHVMTLMSISLVAFVESERDG